MKNVFAKSLSIICLGFLATSCTQREVPTSISLSLDSILNSKTSLSTDEIFFLVVNVRSQDLNTIVWRWDNKNGSDQAPDAIEIDIPAGSNRLIQVLAVGREYGQPALKFIYGDKNVSIGSNFSSDIQIPIQQVGAGSGKEVKVMGRYLLGSISYTGPIHWRFKASSTAPAIEMGKEEMVSGWFNIFVLDDVLFEYYIPELNHVMFGGPVNASNTALAGAANGVMKFSTAPAISPIYRSDDAIFNLEEEHDEIEHSLDYVIGFWKDALADTSSHFLYHDNAAQTSSQRYTNLNTPTGVLTGPLDWLGHFNFSYSSGASIGSGGDLVGTTMIKVPSSIILNGGGNVLISGAFETFNESGDGSSYFKLKESFGALYKTVTWKYLPEIEFGTNPVLGAHVFTKDDAKFEDLGDEDIVDCKGLTSKGFQKIDNLPVATQTLDISVVDQNQSDNMKVVICPYNAKGYLSTVAQNK